MQCKNNDTMYVKAVLLWSLQHYNMFVSTE